MTSLHRRLFTLLASSAVAGSPWAAAPDASCGPDRFETVLAPAASGAVDARAIWVDGQRLRWPEKSADSRFALYHSARAAIVADRGAPVRGADGRVELEPWAPPLPQVVATQFAHLRPGATLALRDADRSRLPDLLRDQLLLVEEAPDGRVLDVTLTQIPAALDALYAAAEHLALGATVSRPTGQAAHTDFRLWAPTARRVTLCLFRTDDGPVDRSVNLQVDPATGAWTTRLPGDLGGQYYVYQVDVMAPGKGLVRNRVTDPYSLSLTTDSTRSQVTNLDAPALAPPGWTTTPRPGRVAAATDLIIYELHVRDFSVGDLSVPAPHRGRYLAFTDTGSDGMQHLKRLAEAGMTDVHLLPVFDFATVPDRGCKMPAPQGAPDSEAQQALVEAHKAEDCFNWGYDPYHFTAPEGSYATDPADGAVRIVEFRRMVQALHRLGLRVGMDVVYNHTTASGQHQKSVLDRIVPGYYHRLNPRGEVERSTCCDNTATEHRMMAKLMIDSAVVWARDHHIDSFRFDLMGHQPRAAMERLQRAVNAATGRHIHLIGEGWNFGEVADGRLFEQASQLSLGGTGIGTFSDRGRDALRGGSAGDNGRDQITRQGFINGQHFDPNPLAAGKTTPADLLRAADLVRVGLAGTLRDYTMQVHTGERLPLARIDYGGQPAGYAQEPGEVVNYVENHDNQTLFDANVFKLPPSTSSEDRARVQVLGAAINMFSQGIAYFHAGQELLRSKSMDRNSYDSGDWFNRLDWTLQDNHFGAGLPPRQDNAESWPLMKPLLANPAIKPTPTDIRWTRDAFLDLLRIRASTTLLRLRSAADIRARLRFHNTGPSQVPGLLVAQINGRDYAGASFDSLVYLINVDKVAHQIDVAGSQSQAFELHPAHRTGADLRLRHAQFDQARGRFNVPARSAVVFVLTGN